MRISRSCRVVSTSTSSRPDSASRCLPSHFSDLSSRPSSNTKPVCHRIEWSVGWSEFAAKQLRKEQIRVPSELGRSMLGVMDETGRLQYGQVSQGWWNDIDEWTFLFFFSFARIRNVADIRAVHQEHHSQSRSWNCITRNPQRWWWSLKAEEGGGDPLQ